MLDVKTVVECLTARGMGPERVRTAVGKLIDEEERERLPGKDARLAEAVGRLYENMRVELRQRTEATVG